MKTLVTGLSGFVGSHCAEQFACVDLELDGQPVDLRRAGDVCAALDQIRPQRVIHLAAQSSVPAAFDDPAGTLDVNLGGTLNLLSALRKTGFDGRMLFVGSGDVYGTVPESELPVIEDRPLRPRNPYAVSKVAAEALCYQWSQTGPFDIVIARPFNHVGPRQDPRFAVASFAQQLVRVRRGKAAPQLTVGDVDATRDFTDVRDVVRAYSHLLESGRSGSTYNVCSGVERSLRSIIETLSALTDTAVALTVASDRLRPSEQRRVRGSHERLSQDTGWQPSIAFEQTLADIIEYWEQKEAA